MKPRMHINNSVDGYYSEKIFHIKQTTQDRDEWQLNLTKLGRDADWGTINREKDDPVTFNIL